MPEPNVTDRLTAVRDLLREGRVNEADRQLDEMQRAIREAEEQRKRDLPPPARRTLAELQIDFADTVTDLLGNPPRLTNLLAEIKAEQPQPEPT
jgi:hypothetical protein